MGGDVSFDTCKRDRIEQHASVAQAYPLGSELQLPNSSHGKVIAESGGMTSLGVQCDDSLS